MEGLQYGNDPNLVTDAAGRSLMAWYSSAPSRLGVQAQEVAAAGAPVGAPLTMPGTGGMTIGMQGRTPLVARAGGGVYVAYPAPQAQNQVRVWRVGAGNAPIVARKRGGGPVTIAAAGDGRLWAVWDDRGSVDAHDPRAPLQPGRDAVGRGGRRPAARAARCRPTGSTRARPAARSTCSASSTSARARTRARSTAAAARPDAEAARAQLRRGRRTTVTFTVRDAGDAVKGAKVKAGGARRARPTGAAAWSSRCRAAP